MTNSIDVNLPIGSRMIGAGNRQWPEPFVQDTSGEIPIGGIILWYGSIVSIPAHWHLCDGSSGTIDLRDKFIICAGSTYAVAATGGETTHALTEAEMPAHYHEVTYVNTADPGAGSARHTVTTPSTPTVNTSTVGSGTAHENMPPYYALAYIQRIS